MALYAGIQHPPVPYAGDRLFASQNPLQAVADGFANGSHALPMVSDSQGKQGNCVRC